MQLSQNRIIFSVYFAAFTESTQNSEYFEKEEGPQRKLLSEIRDCKKWGYLNA